MGLFKPAPAPLPNRILAHPVMGWAQVGLVVVAAASLIGNTVSGVAQALRERKVDKTDASADATS